MVLECWKFICEKLNLNIEFTPYTKINTKLIIYLNAKLRKFREKMDKSPYYLVFGDKLTTTAKVQSMKEKKYTGAL